MIPGTGEIINAGLGLALEGHNDRRQYRQQKKLQGLQIQGQKEMGEYNQKLAMDMWEKTNYAAQRKQMEKAGLNVGLMYEGGGQGGSTQTPTGNVGGGNAAAQSGEIGMGLQLGLQKAMQEAQIKLTEAQTEKTKVETEKTAGVDTQKTGQEAKNLEIQSVILQHEEKIKEIAARVEKGTEQEKIKQIKIENDKAEQEVISAKAQGTIDETTAQDKIKQIKAASTEQMLRISAIEQGIKESNQNIKLMAQKIETMGNEQAQNWVKLDQADKERWVKEAQLELNKTGTEFNTGNTAETKRWVEMITNILNAGIKTAQAAQ